MPKANSQKFIRDKLLEYLEPQMPGIRIEVGHSERWKRMALTFLHERFAGLLPQQRFRAVIQSIPPEFYEENLRGAVWFELAPGETEEAITKARRAEDVAPHEGKIARRLLQAGFFDTVKTTLGESPIEACQGGFQIVRRVLTDLGLTGDDQDDACLVLIGHGAYCDCEVLLVAQPAIQKAHGGE